MTGLEIAGIIVGSVIGYMIGIGVSHKIIYDIKSTFSIKLNYPNLIYTIIY